MDASLKQNNDRWLILGLAMLTNTLVAAVPGMALSVLFNEMSRDLHLSLFQVGLIWGLGSLPGIATVLIAGMVGDRIGPKRVLVASCLLIGVAGALRGLAINFNTLAVTVFLFGLASSFISMNTLKACGMVFSRQQLGLASGVLSMGMALGFLSASLLSATVLSPWLGGWRNVLILYGGIDLLMAIPWLLIRSLPSHTAAGPGPAAGRSSQNPGGPGHTSLRSTFTYVLKIRNVWLYGLVLIGVGGCVQGVLGYIPLYLRGQGWPGPSADGALAAFHTISLLCAIPIALASDRLRSRKKVLLAASGSIILGVSLLSVVSGGWVWLAVCLAGMVRDGFMAVLMTAIIETDGVGPVYAGTAVGIVSAMGNLGSLTAPPLGNSLASLAPGLPFIFWAVLTVMGLIALLWTRDRRPDQALALEITPYG